MKTLVKKIKFFKYSSLFSKNKVFFICMLDNYINYFHLRNSLISKKFNVKFLKNGFVKNLILFFNVKSFLNGSLFCIIKDSFGYKDFLNLNDLLFTKNHVILFYFDNRFYSKEKLQFISNFFKSRIFKLPPLCYFYFLLKLGFILKLEKFNQTPT